MGCHFRRVKRRKVQPFIMPIHIRNHRNRTHTGSRRARPSRVVNIVDNGAARAIGENPTDPEDEILLVEMWV